MWWPLALLASSARAFAICGAYLKHLDEGNREVEVSQVTADQGQREHDTDGHDRAEVDLAVHRNLLPRVEDIREACEQLGHERRERQVPCGKEDCYRRMSALLHESGLQ